MKRLLLIGVCLILWALSTSAKAFTMEQDSWAADAVERLAFSHRVSGTATLADGETIEVDMLLGFQESSHRGWYFRAGPDYVFRDTPPKAYYLNINLDGKGHAYIPEFSDQLIQSFQVQLEGYEIELMQSATADVQYGMRMRINGRQFLFDTLHPRVRINFNAMGLTEVVAEPTLRDLSIRRAN